LQIGVLKDSAAFRDAVNLAANITSEPHNYHIFSLIDVEQSRDLPTRHEIATSQRVRLAPSFVFFDGIPQYSLVYSQSNEVMFQHQHLVDLITSMLSVYENKPSVLSCK